MLSFVPRPPDPRVDLLAAMPLFAQTPRRELERLTALLDEVSVPADVHLFRQGGLGREFVLVIEGRLQVLRDGRTVALLGPGDMAGELSLLGARRRTADVVTLTPVRALVGTPAVLDAVRDLTPGVQDRFDRMVTERRAA